MPFYRAGADAATDEIVAGVLAPVVDVVAVQPLVGPPAGMVAVGVDGLVDTGRGRGGGALVELGAARPGGGTVAVFCRPIVCAPVVVRRDGRVPADGWLPEQVRLRILEAQLGVGLIKSLAADPGWERGLVGGGG